MEVRYEKEILHRCGAVTGCPEKLWVPGCPIPGGAPGQVGQGSGQSDLMGDSPIHDNGIGTRGSLRYFQTQTILWTDHVGSTYLHLER